jgi:hypothetical protein
VAGKHRDPVAVRVALEQRLLAGRQALLVLRRILRGDGEQRRFVGERIGQEAIGVLQSALQ